MAIAVRRQTRQVDEVKVAAARSHARAGRLAVETSLDTLVDDTSLVAPCVVIGALETVEIVLEADADWPGVRLALEALDAAELKAVVLVPSAAMGHAHRELRGAPATLQQWWLEGRRVCFGRSEAL